VKSIADVSFWKLYHLLPANLRQEAREAFRLFASNPAHPSLSFERLRADPESWSVRITRGYRAVGWKRQDTMVWYWIGSHADFDRRFPG
jgi:hypothetical protein